MKLVIKQVESAMKMLRRNTLFIGIASLIWLLYRSGTKPSRVRYPCQQACLANVSMYLSPSILLLAHRVICVREILTIRAVLRGVFGVILFFSCFLLIEGILIKVPVHDVPPAGEEMLQHEALGIQLNAENSMGRSVYATSPQA
jgi:hypothetical protein